MKARHKRQCVRFANSVNVVSNPEIGDAQVIGGKTVARHRENLMRKLNLHSRVELIRYAIRKWFIEP
ncbi:MAG TPA: LuxR C-terminal-related transcriptional regulator [Anaerolineales bacterium]